MIITFYGFVNNGQFRRMGGISQKCQLELVVQGLDQLVQPKLVALDTSPRDGDLVLPGQQLALEFDISCKGVFFTCDVQDYCCVDLTLLVVFQLEIREQDLLEGVLEDALLLFFQSRQEVVDPQQDGFWGSLGIPEAVFLSLTDVLSLDVEVKDGFCGCKGLGYSNAYFLSRPVLSGPFPFHLIFVHHPLQVISQVSPDSPRLLVSSHQFLIPRLEIGIELLIAQDGSLEPRMIQHLLSSQPFLRISNKHTLNQVLKRCRKGLHFSLKLAPKQLQLALSDHVVLLIGNLCVLERRDPHKHQEQDYTSCKHIHLFSLIEQLMDLRGYVTLRPSPGSQEIVVIIAFCVPGEPEVCQFDIESPIQQDVLKFDVSMGDFNVFEVFEGCDQLEEEGSADIL